MYINQILELTKTLDSEKFKDAFSRVQEQCEFLSEREDTYLDHTLSSKGITVQYRDSTYKKKVIITINTWMLMGDSKPCADKLLHKISKAITSYFDSEFVIDDFKLSKVCLVKDLHIGSRDDLDSYLKVMKRVGKVKGFSPSAYDFLDTINSFCLSGNSNGVEFIMYDLEQATANRSSGINENIRSFPKGVLRAEVRLMKPMTIRNFTDKPSTLRQVAALYEKREKAFMETFIRVIPFGDFYKKGRAVEIIRRSVEDSTMERKMLRLLELVPEKKSLWLAQKALGSRNIEAVMEAFARINLSPVTIGKRHDVKHLKSLYSYL